MLSYKLQVEIMICYLYFESRQRLMSNKGGLLDTGRLYAKPFFKRPVKFIYLPFPPKQFVPKPKSPAPPAKSNPSEYPIS